jgi:Flp pilus assembly protein TadD/dienelactone hydrolase
MKDAPASNLPDTEVFYAMPSDSSTAIVSFSPKGGRRGYFYFFKLLESLPSLSKLLVRDPFERWYNAGLPEVGDTLEEIAARIEQELSTLGASRVVTFGSSMGGYAAILFGCMIGAERAIALAPQTLLDPVLPLAPPPDVDLQAPDLAPIVSAAPRTKVDLVVGWNDLTDVFHATRIASLPAIRILALPNAAHAFAQDIHDKGKLASLITTLIEGDVPSHYEVDPPLEPDFEQRIADTVYAVRRADWSAVAEKIGPVAEGYPSWAAPNFHFGRALANLGEWEAAEAALARAVQANPGWNRPREELGLALRELGRTEEVEVVIREGLALDPKWWRGYLGLGEHLLQQARHEEARSTALQAEQILRKVVAKFPKLADGYLDLGRALVQLDRREEARSVFLRAVELDPELTKAAEQLHG